MRGTLLFTSRVLGLAGALLALGLVPTSTATAAESWSVEVGSTGTVLPKGAGLTVPVTISCPDGYDQFRLLNLQIYDDGSNIGFYFADAFPCDGTPHTTDAVVVSRSRVLQGTVFATATVCYGAPPCDFSVSTPLREVTLSRDAAALDSTSTLALGSTGTATGTAEPATVDVIVTCETGQHSPFGATVGLYQSEGWDTSFGFGSTSAFACLGTPQTFSVLVRGYRNDQFHPGFALAVASMILCPDGQTVSHPGGTGPGCRTISEAAEIRLVR